MLQNNIVTSIYTQGNAIMSFRATRRRTTHALMATPHQLLLWLQEQVTLRPDWWLVDDKLSLNRVTFSH